MKKNKSELKSFINSHLEYEKQISDFNVIRLKDVDFLKGRYTMLCLQKDDSAQNLSLKLTVKDSSKLASVDLSAEEALDFYHLLHKKIGTIKSCLEYREQC